MNSTLLKFSIGAASALFVLMPCAHASNITLNTAWLDANAVLGLSNQALQALEITGIGVTAGGAAANLGQGRFNLPITQLTADVKLLPPALTPVAGKVDGASLLFSNSLNGKQLSVSKLQLDFSTETISGLITSGANTTQTTLFSFDVASPLHFSLKGGISLSESLSNLRMTSNAASTFAKDMGLPPYLETVLTGIEFGHIDATIRPWFRTPVASVPEPGTSALWGLGLLGLFARVRSRARQAAAGETL